MKNRKTIDNFTPLAMDYLIKYEWPGNVRELENAIERAVILCNGNHVSERELPPSITKNIATLSFRIVEWKGWQGFHLMKSRKKQSRKLLSKQQEIKVRQQNFLTSPGQP